MQYTMEYLSPLGEILLASDGEALTGLWFAGQKYAARGLSPGAVRRDLPVFTAARAWQDAYFAGRDPGDPPPLRPAGTAFQRDVWTLLTRIPRGKTTTYGALARTLAAQMGRATMSAQAIGSAVGRNPISIMIPCHRVVGADGGLVGYAGGVARKRALLMLEGVHLSIHIKGGISDEIHESMA